MPVPRKCCILCGALIQCGWGFVTVYALISHDLRIPGLEARLSVRGFRFRLADVAHVSIPRGPHGGPTESEMGIDLMPSGITSHPIRPGETPDIRGFPFHPACWYVLTKRLSPGDREVQLLFDLCLSFRNNEIMLDWGHDYGGTVGYDYDSRVLGPGEEPRLSSLAVDSRDDGGPDPLHIPELRRAFERRTTDSISATDLPAPRQGYARPADRDAFQALPVEILQSTLIYLSTPDVAAVRIASPAFANVHLHDKFWRSRFFPGQEFESVFEAQPHLHDSSFKGQWKSTYFAVRELRRSPELLNRRRVWDLASSLLDLLFKAESASCDGSPVPFSLDDDDDDDDNSSLSSVDMGWKTASRANPISKRCFVPGKSSLYKRMMPIPDDATALFVSTVEIQGRQYISGIRIQHGTDASVSLGYHRPGNETPVVSREQGSLRIEGFNLAHDQRGIRGLSVISETRISSDWVGDFHGIPKRRLVLREHDVVKHLKGGFDALRLRSLSISNGRPSNTDAAGPKKFDHTTLWHPDFPGPHLTFLGAKRILNPHPGEDLPLSTMIFGGVKGEELQHVLGITVWVDERNDPIPTVLAIDISRVAGPSPHRFGYTDLALSTVSYSPIQKFEFPIDGPSGERIVKMESCYGDGGDWFAGFQVLTNYRRAAVLPPTIEKRWSLGKWRTKPLRFSRGAFVGFWGMWTYNRGFSDFGAICIDSSAEADSARRTESYDIGENREGSVIDATPSLASA
ncbi:hypothetical protein N657DRAFT_651413 [Parathielavia appendiculata]|uniref:F-box domain-containing protein n=1 Tax=Parathielavia appendiculata TaxID=2587402 RepID=A0AAN6YZE9_9PEZI|nr:hypothetical protein N657DRAFT_651413 [Parathielavia appendiculata]